MNQLTIDVKNAFEVQKTGKPKTRRSGYVRKVRFLDNKEHPAPRVYEGDLSDMFSHGSI